jgi:hypothetical protein
MPRRNKNLEEQISENYYTAKEAQDRLGMNRDKFNYTMKTRGIERIPFLGGYGYYKKSDIDGLADEIETFLLIGGKTELQYRTATLEDMDAEIELAAFNFGRVRAERTKEPRIRYMQANPEMTHYLFADGRMVASINLLPLSHEAILDFRRGIRGWTFHNDQIKRFEPGQRLECIIIDMMTTTKVTLDTRHRYASYLLRHLVTRTLVDWAKQGIEIATVDACAGTEDGERILKRSGFIFAGRFDTAHEERDMYHLDIDASTLLLLRDYKQTLAEWKQEHSPLYRYIVDREDAEKQGPPDPQEPTA